MKNDITGGTRGHARDKRAGRVAGWVVVAVLGGFLGGCATRFPAYHINVSSKDDLAVGGIYYSLPRTVIDFRLRLEHKAFDGGELSNVLACAYGLAKVRISKTESVDPCVLKDQPSVWTPLAAEILDRAESDREQVYRVVPSTHIWITQSHTFKNALQGFVKSANSEGTNEAGPIAAAAVKALLAYGTGGVGGALASVATNAQAKTSDFSLSVMRALRDQDGTVLAKDPLAVVRPQGVFDGACDKKVVDPMVLIREVDKLFEAEPRTLRLKLAEAKCIVRAIEEKERVVAAAVEAQWQPLAVDQVKDAPDGYVAALLKQRKRIAEARGEELAALRIALHVDPVEKATRFSLLTVKPVDPGKPPKESKLSSPGMLLPDWKVEALALPDLKAAAKLGHDFLDKHTVCAVVERTESAEPLEEVKPSGPGLGYRYRLPAQGRVALYLGVKKEATQCSTESTLLAAETKSIAQFGAVVALPESFSGKDVKVELLLTEHGTMEQVTLGQKARDAAAATDVIDALAKRRSDRAAAAKDAPLNAANAQADVRAALVKDKLALRCLDQLDSLPADAPLPEACK